jgi:hypothetical protein
MVTMRSASPSFWVRSTTAWSRYSVTPFIILGNAVVGRATRRYNGGVDIETFDAATASAGAAEEYADLVARARASAHPVGLPPPAAYTLNRLRHRSPDHRVHVWTCRSGSALVGAVELYWWEAEDNRDRSWVPLDVPSGDASVADALGPLSAWTEARGGRLGCVEEHNVVRLSPASRADLAALAGDVPAGYELVTFDVCPEPLLEPFSVLIDTMNDAPLEDLTMEDIAFTPERVRRWERGLADRGHTVWNVVARSTSTGELAAFNQLVVRPEWPEVVENEDTAVAVPHRGHGLGLWIKAVNLLRVVDTLPLAQCVETWNAASNEHMLRVNRRLGFVAEHEWESWEVAAPALVREAQPA